MKPKLPDNTPEEELSHPARGAWIETTTLPVRPTAAPSHPARGAWIETRGQIASHV